MHERREPPRKAFSLPDAAQAAVGIRVEARCALVAIELGEPAREIADIRGCEVQPFAPVGGTMLRRVAGQEQAGRIAAARPRSCAAARCSFRSTARSSRGAPLLRGGGTAARPRTPRRTSSGPSRRAHTARSGPYELDRWPHPSHGGLRGARRERSDEGATMRRPRLRIVRHLASRTLASLVAIQYPVGRRRSSL